MQRGWGLLIAAATAVPTGTGAAPQPSEAPVCPPVVVFDPELSTLHGYHLTTGTDGKTRVEPLTIDAKSVPLMKTGKTLNLFDLPTAPKRAVQLVAAPAGMTVPPHPAPYREMFLILSGSTTLEVGPFKTVLTPGMVMFAEDVGAVDGHGGTTGPCGYVAVSIAP